MSEYLKSKIESMSYEERRSLELYLTKNVHDKLLPEYVFYALQETTEAERVELWLLLRRATATTGVLPKHWYNIDGKKFLVKGNSHKGLEPYSEVLASTLAELLGLDCVHYTLAEASKYPEVVPNDNCKHVSVCESYSTDKTLWSLPYSDYMESESKSREMNPLLKLVDTDLFDITDVFKILQFDAIIGNTDRHTGNIEIIKERGAAIKVGPIFDNGLSMLSAMPINMITVLKGIDCDEAKPFASTHAEQISRIKKYWSNDMIQGKSPSKLVEDMFNLNKEVTLNLSSRRVAAIEKYLNERLKLYGRI